MDFVKKYKLRILSILSVLFLFLPFVKQCDNVEYVNSNPICDGCKVSADSQSLLSDIIFYLKVYFVEESKSCKKLQISSDNYKKLILFINESFQTKSGEFLKIETDAVYGKHDVFYEANGSYSLFYTCNSWANQALKAANQKAALWTISDSGIFRHYN